VSLPVGPSSIVGDPDEMSASGTLRLRTRFLSADNGVLNHRASRPCGAHDRNRTCDPLFGRQTLYQLSYTCTFLKHVTGIEPATACLQDRCSAELSYTCVVEESQG
jgi:hypothetical protein